MSRPHVGVLLQEWRHRRNRSQLELSSEVGVSARHLSFVETGRSRPSPELVIALCTHLDVPLRDRNVMLLAAGYAPRYSQSSLDDPAMTAIRRSLQRMLDAQDPYPGVVIDRRWNVLLGNAAAMALVDAVAPPARCAPLNVFRMCLHPEGLASRTLNFDDWAAYLLGQIRRTVRLTYDEEMIALEREVLAYPNVAALPAPSGGPFSDDPPLLVPFELDMGDARWSLFTTLTTFGTPRDITLEEISVELFFPADDRTEAMMRSSGSATGAEPAST